MVLCKFFQQGNCRFGTKCANEHFDVKQIIKSDVETAINGKQWPFSCYGPFKDRPCVPNFIEDQSFEEIRWKFFDSQQKNIIDQFLQQLNVDVATSTNKMKMLLQLTPDVVDIIIQLYDLQTPGNSIFNKTAATSAPGNIFGSGFNSGTAVGNVFGGQVSEAQNTMSTTSIFGGTTNTAGSTNMFQTANSNAQSVFGQAVAKPAANNLFGNAPAQHPTNLFQSNAAASGGNLFASAVQQPNQFGQAAPQFPQQQMQHQSPASGGGNIFAQAVQQFPQNVPTTAPQQQTTGFFQQAQTMESQQQQPFGAQSQPAPTPTPANTAHSVVVYSRMEDLTVEEIEAFKSDIFLPGSIPCNPPPKELVKF